MDRRNFAQVLKDAKVDINREYERLFLIFNARDNDGQSLREMCEKFFLSMPFHDTYLSLQEFDICNGFVFEMPPIDFDINYLINFCEYIYNLVYPFQKDVHLSRSKFPNPLQHIRTLIEKIGYMIIDNEGVKLFVPKSQPAIVVSEMLPSDLSYKVIEYNHHSMKGDLARKQATLKLLADQLESNRAPLKSLNKSLEDDLFYLLNNINIRHNNIDSSSTKYKRAVADMPKDELEEWYDRTYDICLYAFMTLDQADRNAKVKELKAEIECSKE